MRGVSIVLSFLAAGSIAGCGSDGSNINQPSPRDLPSYGISIVPGAQNKGTGAFSPNPRSISLASSTAGQVTWFNDDHSNSSYSGSDVTHNITGDDGSFSAELTPYSTLTISYTDPGTYTYHCSIHPTMKGTVIVTP